MTVVSLDAAKAGIAETGITAAAMTVKMVLINFIAI